MGRIYGYCRVSSKKQNIERQVRNILAVYPTAIIVKEVYTRTSFYGRKECYKPQRKSNGKNARYNNGDIMICG